MRAFEIACARRLNAAISADRRMPRHVDIDAMSWHVDYFSSGPTWAGWAETRPPLPGRYEPLETSAPATWLLSKGWMKHGAVSMYAVPGRDCEEA